MLKRAIILSIAAAAMLAACSDGLSESEKSGAFGFPVPASAKLSDTKSTDASEFYSYNVYSNYDDLLEWYSGRLIKGRNRGDWQWCDSQDLDAFGGHWRVYVYVHPNGSTIEISLLKNSREAGGQVAIAITEKTDGARYTDCDA